MSTSVINKNSRFAKKLLDGFLEKEEDTENDPTSDQNGNNTSTNNKKYKKKKKKKQSVIKTLLKDPAPSSIENLRRQQEFYTQTTTDHAKKAFAIIFVLKVKPKPNDGHQKVELDANEKFTLLQIARDMFRTKIFNRELRLIKFVNEHVFAMCHESSPQIALRGMLRAKEFIDGIDTPRASFDVSGGCCMGSLFTIHPRDYYADPINIASKLCNDIAEPGEMLVSFGT